MCDDMLPGKDELLEHREQMHGSNPPAKKPKQAKKSPTKPPKQPTVSPAKNPTHRKNPTRKKPAPNKNPPQKTPAPTKTGTAKAPNQPKVPPVAKTAVATTPLGTESVQLKRPVGMQPANPIIVPEKKVVKPKAISYK